MDYHLVKLGPGLDATLQIRMIDHKMIEKLIDILNTTVMDFFEDSMIVNVVLQLITLFTSKSENPSLFDHSKILKYVFSRLKGSDPEALEDETLRLAALAMSRLTSRFDSKKVNCELYIKEIEELAYYFPGKLGFEIVLPE